VRYIDDHLPGAGVTSSGIDALAEWGREKRVARRTLAAGMLQEAADAVQELD
jgi:hypothetical protein